MHGDVRYGGLLCTAVLPAILVLFDYVEIELQAFALLSRGPFRQPYAIIVPSRAWILVARIYLRTNLYPLSDNFTISQCENGKDLTV